MKPRTLDDGPIDERMDGLVKDSYQVTVENAQTKTKSTVYIAKEAVPPEFNTYLYIAESKEAMEEMIKTGAIKDKGVVLVGEGLERTAYFIKNGALVTRIDSDDKVVPVTSPLSIPEEKQLEWSPTYYAGAIGKSSDSREIESTIDNAIRKAGRSVPLPLKKDRESFLQKTSMALVAAHASTFVPRYYIGAITHNSQDKYDLFFTSPSARLASQHHSFRISASIENIKASKVTTGKVRLEQGEEHQAKIEQRAREFNALHQQATQQRKPIPLEVEKKAPAVATSPLIEENAEAREAKEKAVFEEAKQFFNLSKEELDLFEVVTTDFTSKMRQCSKTISDLEKEIKKLSKFSQSHSELASRVEKNTAQEKKELLHLMRSIQDKITEETRINLQQMKEEKDSEFKEYLLAKYREAQKAILSDALICNLMENAIRDTLLEYKGKDKQIILDTLQAQGIFKNAKDIIFNSPLDKTQLVSAINTVFDKMNTYIGQEHPYSAALKAALQVHLGDRVQRTTEFFIFKKDKLEIDEKTLQQSRETLINAFKENILIKRKKGAVTLDGIHQKTEKQITNLQQAQQNYLKALDKERDDFVKITGYRTTILTQENDTLVKINALLKQAEQKRKEADALLEQVRIYELSGVPHQRMAWEHALAFHTQVESTMNELVTLRNNFKEEAKLPFAKASSKDITVEECHQCAQEMEKIANAALLSSQEKLTVVRQKTSQLDDVTKTVKIENTQQEIFYLLKTTLLGEGQIAYWNDQRKIGGTEINDGQGKIQKVPTGIGKMIGILKAISLKEGGISDVQSLLEACGQAAQDRLSRKVFLGHGKKIGRQEATSEIYGLIKDIKDNLHDLKKLELSLSKLRSSKAYTQYQARQHKQFKEMERKQELR